LTQAALLAASAVTGGERRRAPVRPAATAAGSRMPGHTAGRDARRRWRSQPPRGVPAALATPAGRPGRASRGPVLRPWASSSPPRCRYYRR